MSNKKSKSKNRVKSKAKAKVKTRAGANANAATPAPASGHKYRLTVAKDKTAVLLRLPKATIKIIDQMAKDNAMRRTEVLYTVIAEHPELAVSMQPLVHSQPTQEISSNEQQQ